MTLTELKSRCFVVVGFFFLEVAFFSGGSRGLKNPFSFLFFQSLDATHVPCLMAPFSMFKSINVASSNLFLTLTFCLPLPSSEDSHDHRDHLDMPGSSTHPTISNKVPFVI